MDMILCEFILISKYFLIARAFINRKKKNSNKPAIKIRIYCKGSSQL